jgi:hypothetical protein
MDERLIYLNQGILEANKLNGIQKNIFEERESFG